MNALLLDTDPPSPTRDRLCNRANAERVAARMFDATGSNIAIVRTDNPIQPFRVLPSREADYADVELEMVR
jgi:hypothetical protein